MDVKFGIRGLPEVQKMLREMPRGVTRIAVGGFTDYLLGDDTHGLKHYPPPKGQKYVRTYTLKKGWSSKGDEYRPVIVNYTPYAVYVPRWKKYGWREWMDVVLDNVNGALRHAQALVSAYLTKWK
jgi:hypothetical protein